MSSSRAGSWRDAWRDAVKRQRTEEPESTVDALNADRDPKALHEEKEIILRHAEQTMLDGVTCGEGEQRCFVLTEYQQLGLFFPTGKKGVNRDAKNPLLLAWEYTKLLSPDWYAVVFELKASPGVYRAVPDEKLALDDYPAASRSAKDAETVAGFGRREDLRLVLRPQAFRFFWYGLHEPMLVAGAWPPAREVQLDGYRLKAEVRTALAAKLAAIPAGAATAWLQELRAALERRHWPGGTPPVAAATDAPPPAAEAPPPAAEAPVAAAEPAAVDERPDALDGMLWAYDLDSVVVSERNDDELGQMATFGFTRILQIVARDTPPQDARVTQVSPQPPWARDLMLWLSSWHDGHSSYDQPLAMLHWRLRSTSVPDGAPHGFWRKHEARVWQFSAPIELEEVSYSEENSMYWLHSFLTGCGEHYTAFSPSLRASSWQALGFGQAQEESRGTDDWPHPLFADGTWDLGGYGHEGVTASAVRALLPFYEPMRRAHRDRGKSSR